MATLTINTTSAQDARIVTAFGRTLNLRTPDKSAQRDATAAEVKAAVIGFIRDTVVNYETGLAIEVASAAVPDITPT